MSPQTPQFDPSKPFTIVGGSGRAGGPGPSTGTAPAPAFDPSKPFTEIPAAAATDNAGSPAEDMIALQYGRQLLGPVGEMSPALAKTVGDGMLGMLKGLGHTAESLGRLPHLIPGFTGMVENTIVPAIDRLKGGASPVTPGISSAAFAEADRLTTPSNTAQRIGYGAEQIGEVIVPGAKQGQLATKAAEVLAPKLAPVVGQTAARILPRAAVEATGNAAMSLAQGGDPRTGAAFGAAGAVAAPALRAGASAIAPKLKEAAQTGVVKALGPTKERFKAMAAKIAPDVLKRGLTGSRESLYDLSRTMKAEIGPQINEAIERFGENKAGIDAVVLRLEEAKDAYRLSHVMDLDEAIQSGYAVMRPGGGLMLLRNVDRMPTGQIVKTVETNPRALQQLSDLQKTLRDLGPDATVKQLVAVRRTWDKVVDQAGGYTHRAGGAIGQPLADASEAATKREATSAIRELLDEAVPDLSRLNKQYSFWTSLNQVLRQTLQRTQPQGQGIGRTIAQGAGATAGALVGAQLGGAREVAEAAIIGGALADTAKKVFTSPQWRLLNAQAKDRLADAITSGSVGRIQSEFYRIAAIQGSKVGAPTPAPVGGGG